MILRLCLLGLLLSSSFSQARSQDVAIRFKQARDGEAVQTLTTIEAQTLGDPLFNLVLKKKADKTSLQDILDNIQPDTTKRQTFVVHERIVSQTPTNASRRVVISFTGVHDGEELQGNVMLSASIRADGTVPASIEAWGWDNHLGKYNYYKLDSVGASPGQLTWKFRGNSTDADLLSPAERSGTCLQCHTNGAPVMKELAFPWNNWHGELGNAFKADYIDPKSSHPNKWPAANSPLMNALKGAEKLEIDHIIPALNRFCQSRVNAMLLRDDASGNRMETDGKLTLVNAPRVLRGLFVPTELNFISSANTSGFHPLGNQTNLVPSQVIRVPEDFFVNSGLIAGGPAGGGLQLASAKKFKNLVQLTQSENKSFCEKFDLRLSSSVGDCQFAWFMPSNSYTDTRMANQLLELGAVTPHFLAAVVAIDLESPLFSDERSSLLKYLPDQYQFVPLDEGTDPTAIPHDTETDLLTKSVIAKIAADSPASTSTAAKFLKLLQSNDAVALLDQQVEKYFDTMQSKISSTAQRPAEMERLFQVLIERRRLFQANPLFSPLDETGGRLLLPFPANP